MKRISNTVTQLTWLQDTPSFVSPFDNKSNKHYKMVLRKNQKQLSCQKIPLIQWIRGWFLYGLFRLANVVDLKKTCTKIKVQKVVKCLMLVSAQTVPSVYRMDSSVHRKLLFIGQTKLKRLKDPPMMIAQYHLIFLSTHKDTVFDVIKQEHQYDSARFNSSTCILSESRVKENLEIQDCLGKKKRFMLYRKQQRLRNLQVF